MSRIYIVEDDKNIAESIAKQLQLWNMEGICVHDFAKVDENGDGLIVIPDGSIQLTGMQILWAMAKTATGSVKKFDLWCEDFDLLPTREIVDCCFEIWQQANAGTVELKN